jgi:hypothetical protein
MSSNIRPRNLQSTADVLPTSVSALGGRCELIRLLADFLMWVNLDPVFRVVILYSFGTGEESVNKIIVQRVLTICIRGCTREDCYAAHKSPRI